MSRRDVHVQRVANLVLRLASRPYRSRLHGYLLYGINAAVRDASRGHSRPMVRLTFGLWRHGPLPRPGVLENVGRIEDIERRVRRAEGSADDEDQFIKEA